MGQGKGGAVIHSGIQGSKCKYPVGGNWAYDINSSQGAHVKAHRFSELHIKGIWHLLITPIWGKTVENQDRKLKYGTHGQNLPSQHTSRQETQTV